MIPCINRVGMKSMEMITHINSKGDKNVVFETHTSQIFDVLRAHTNSGFLEK